MIRITDGLLTEVSHRAKQSERKRGNLNFHRTAEDPVQRFLNAVEPSSYLRPHKHQNPDTPEVFILLRGRVLIVEFDDGGKIVDHVTLDWEKGNKGVEIPPRVFHTFISLEEGSVLYEVKRGPYCPDAAKRFATWAPAEESEEGLEFTKRVLQELGIGSEKLQEQER